MVEYDATMYMQWLLRLLDFFSVSMVIPTMPQFLVSVGGTADDYYQVLLAGTGMQLVITLLVGWAVDATKDIRKLYLPLCTLSAMGGGLYALADAVEALRSPRTILAARLLSGAGQSKTTLVFVYLARAVRTDTDRRRWLVSLSTARSLGLFVGPALAVALVWLSGCTPEDPGGSVLGCYALPGTFLFAANTSAAVMLFATWAPPPASPLRIQRSVSANSSGREGTPLHGRSPSLHKEISLKQFFTKPHVSVVSLIYIFALGVATTVEFVVPVVTSRVLLWPASGGSAVLMAISLVVLSNQLALMWFQSWTTPSGRLLIDDCAFLMVGIACLAITFIVTSLFWVVFIGFGPSAPELARRYWPLVVFPIVLLEFWFPYLGNGTNMTFTRLVLTHVPSRTGICQALINSNGPYIGQLTLTGWMGLTFSGAEISDQGAPQVAFVGIALLLSALAVALARCYSRVRPPSTEAEEPMLERISTPLSISRSVSVGDLTLPLDGAERAALGVDDQPSV